MTQEQRRRDPMFGWLLDRLGDNPLNYTLHRYLTLIYTDIKMHYSYYDEKETKPC